MSQKQHRPRAALRTTTRLRARPGAALMTAVLVGILAFLAAALPRAVESSENAALRETLNAAGLQARSVSASSISTMNAEGSRPGRLLPKDLAATEQTFRRIVRPPLALPPGQTVYGVRNNKGAEALNRQLPHPSRGVNPQSTLVAQPGLARHSRLLGGRLPRTQSADGPYADARSVEAALTADTAKVLGLSVGDTVRLGRANFGPLRVRITGIVRPRDPHHPYWNFEQQLRAPSLATTPSLPGSEPLKYWRFTALLDPASTPVIRGMNAGALAYWHHPADLSALTARQVPALRAQLRSLQRGPGAVRLQHEARQPAVSVEPQGGLARQIGVFADEQAATAPLVRIAALGTGAVGLVLLLMTGQLSAARRERELSLLRARGSSLAGLGGRLLAETAAAAIPGAAAGTGLALLLVPAERWAQSVLLGAAAGLLGALVLPLRAMAAHRRPRVAVRRDVASARPTRRRTVAELTVVVLAGGAVALLRSRQGAGAGGEKNSADLLTAATPVLLALAAALLLLRLYPLPLRLLARPVGRLRGAVAHLGLTGAARAPAHSVLPLVAVLVALTVTSFGGSVLGGVAAGQDRAALDLVGADARVRSPDTLPAALPARVRHVTGVRQVASVRGERVSAGGVGSSGLGTVFEFLVVDPEDYARLSDAVRLSGEPFPRAALARPAREGVLPAIVSPGISKRYGDSVQDLQAAAGLTKVRAVSVIDRTPAAPTGEFIIVSAAAMARDNPGESESLLKPNALYAGGSSIDGTALRAALRSGSGKGSGKGSTIGLRAEFRAELADSELQAGARRIYLAAVAAGTALSAAALLISLLDGAPQRRARLDLLRTLGMGRRSARNLALLEALPQVLLAAAGGMLVGAATVPLLRPGVDLTALVFSSGGAIRPPPGAAGELGLRTDLFALLAPSLGLLLLAAAVLLAQGLLCGRRRANASPTTGDSDLE